MDKGEQQVVLLSKLVPPQSSPTALLRSRLLTLLNKNRGKKLILVCAGAGYGKTTLVSQFLTREKMKHLYYQLDGADADPATFMSYLLTGLQKIDRQFGKKTERLSEFLNYFDAYQDIIIGTFLNEIIERFKHDLYIVLEDYHVLKKANMVNDILNYMLEHLPPKLHIIITSRSMPELNISRLRARDEMLELTTHHLRFSLQEIEKLFRKVYQQPLKTKEARWIEQHSEGWPTSLRLMLQSSDYLEGIKSSRYVREILDRYYQSQVSLFNYFAQEIFSKESKAMQQFLVDCSLFDWLTPGLCNAITNKRSCGKVLARLTRRNAFLFRIHSKGYRFHHLYQEFLNSKMTNVQRERKLYRQAAAYFYRQNQFEDALKYYIEGEQYGRVGRLVTRIGYSLIRQGRGSVLCSYIETVPARLRNRNPGVLIMYAQALVHMGRSEEARNLLLRAVRLLKRVKGKRVHLADALYELGGIYLNQDKYREARRYFTRALKACPKRSSVTRAAVLNSLGFVHSALGGRYVGHAEKFFMQAYQSAHRRKYGELKASVLNNWALHDWKRGDIHPAYQKLTEMVLILDSHYSPHCGAGYFNAARLCLVLGKTHEAQQILDSGSRICSQFNDRWSMAALWKGYGLLYSSLGEYSKAKKYLERSLKVYEDLGLVRLSIASLNELCRVHIALSEFIEAEKNLSAIWWFKKNKRDSEAVNLLITEGKLRVAQHKYALAIKVLESALMLALRFKHSLNIFNAYITLSRAFYGGNMVSRSIEQLEKAVGLARLKGYDHLLVQTLERDRWMVHVLRRRQIEPDYISKLIMGSTQYTRCIGVTLFGTPVITIDDVILDHGAWKTKNAEKLFCYLLMQHEDVVSNDHLLQVFWPESDTKTGRYNVRKTIQYIRQTLAEIDNSLRKVIRSGKGVYSIARDVEVSIDTETFEYYVSKIRCSQRANTIEQKDLDTVLQLYRGDFADGWYDNWVEEKRRYYKRLYEEVLNIQALQCMKHKQYRDALRYYSILLDLNGFEESYHREYWKACAKCKRHRDIIQDYKNLSALLKHDLDRDPELETTRLYHALVKGR